MLVLPFPSIDPVAVSLGPVVVRWYALAYLAGFILGWKWCVHLAKKTGTRPNPADIEEFIAWSVLGVILGGRFGYVLFYNPANYLAHPLEIFQIWRGGMSFHGGLLGMVAAIILFGRYEKISVLRLGDLIACAAPIGLFFGRIANFINGELWGRPTNLPWGIIFPHAGPEPRHPSQFYEAFLEGIVLFAVVNLLARHPKISARPGVTGGIFLIGYGLARMLGEIFREPDPQYGQIWGPFTMGQLLSIPMVLAGLGLVIFARRKAQTPNQA